MYRSRDSGVSWERLGEGEFLRDVFVSRGGEHALVLAGMKAWLWSGGAELELMPLGERKLYHLTARARAGDLWIATAFEAAEDEKTQQMLVTSDTTLVGPALRALLFTSIDEGRSWKRIAEHEGAIVQATWLGDAGFFRMYLSDGTLRGGTVDARDGTLAGGELQLFSSQAHGGDWGTWLLFPDADTGWMGGTPFKRGDARLARTSDGGRTWSAVEPAPRSWIRAFRLGGGACVRVIDGYGEPNRLEQWREGEFRVSRRFGWKVREARVDAGGRLLLRLENGDVSSLAADGSGLAPVFPKR